MSSSSDQSAVDSIADLVEKITLNHYDTGSAYWVDITHINNPHSFYVRPTAYREYVTVVQAHGDTIDASEVQPRATVVYKSKTLDKYIRGQILFTEYVNEDVKCDMFASDYGLLEKSVPLQDIRKPVHVNIPPLASHCQLADCKPIDGKWSEKVVEAMRWYVGTERAKMIIREKTPEVLVVELLNSCPDDIATMLALTGYTVFGYGENVINRFSDRLYEKHYFTYKVLNIDDVLHVRVQSGKSLKSFYVAQVNDYRHYLNERDNFTYFSKKQNSLRSEDLRKGKSVAVLVDSTGKYERSVIIDIIVPEKKALVQLVDLGKSIEVDISHIKPMSSNFFNYPAAAIFCSADESQCWNNGLHKFLYPGYEFLITIKDVGNTFLTPNVVNISPIS